MARQASSAPGAVRPGGLLRLLRQRPLQTADSIAELQAAAESIAECGEALGDEADLINQAPDCLQDREYTAQTANLIRRNAQHVHATRARAPRRPVVRRARPRGRRVRRVVGTRAGPSDDPAEPEPPNGRPLRRAVGR